LAAFAKSAGVRFRSLELLNLSFVHRSVSNEAGHRQNNERLEFLGDAILGAVAATLLYKDLSDRPEGDLAKIKSVVVSEDILSGIARELQIDRLLILGRGEELSGGRAKNAILADAMEALIGALYLDSGYKAAQNFVGSRLGPEIARVLDNRHHQDYKSLLQELSQRLYRKYPAYRLLKRSGPEHDRFFWMEVAMNGQTYGPGMGKNKKTAEQEAARIAYEALSPPRQSPPGEAVPDHVEGAALPNASEVSE
jgi:ribonuclease-3